MVTPARYEDHTCHCMLFPFHTGLNDTAICDVYGDLVKVVSEGFLLVIMIALTGVEVDDKLKLIMAA